MKKAIFPILIISGFLNVNYCQNWFNQTSGINFGLNSVLFVNDYTGFAVGMYNSTRYTLKTTNGGSNWFTQTIPAPADLRSLYFINENTGYAAGIGYIFKTTDGGSLWTQSLIFISEEYYTIAFVNSSTGFAAGYISPGHLRKTTNSGLSWFEQTPYSPTSYISSIFFANSSTGYFSSDLSGRIQKTTNSGLSWDMILNSYPYLIKAVHFEDPSTGYAICNRNPPFTSHNMFLKTSNGGLSWDSSVTGTTSNLNSLFFTSVNVGYICTDSGQILSTSNAGANWIIENLPGGIILKSIYFSSQSTGYAVGSGGQIYKTTNGGGILVNTSSNRSGLPNKFMLYQNYPNPFNPTSKIKFHIEKLSDVKLVIYDIFGREVNILINEKLSPGIYEADWDGTNYPSGVYFYKLTAIDPSTSPGFRYSETKKMILVK